MDTKALYLCGLFLKGVYWERGEMRRERIQNSKSETKVLISFRAFNCTRLKAVLILNDGAITAQFILK